MHYFKYSLYPKKLLEETCDLLKIPKKKGKLDVKTRWGSTLAMIERYMKLESAFQYLYLSEKDLRINQNVLNKQESELIKETVLILKEIETTSNYFGQNKVSTISEVQMIMKGIKLWFQNYLGNQKNPLVLKTFVKEMDLKLDKASFTFLINHVKN